MTDSSTETQNRYGVADGSYQAAGQLDGITRLVDCFYNQMESQPFALTIRNMHPEDLTESRRKLTFFLSGWLGGPRLYAEHYGSISIPFAHRHLAVAKAEKDAWMQCMTLAVESQPFAQDFKSYLITQLQVPADRIESVCQKPAQPA